VIDGGLSSSCVFYHHDICCVTLFPSNFATFKLCYLTPIPFSCPFILAFKTKWRRRRRGTFRQQEGSPSCCSSEKASSPSSSSCGSNSSSHAGTSSRPTTKRGNALGNWLYHSPGYGVRDGICHCSSCSWRCCQLIWWK